MTMGYGGVFGKPSGPTFVQGDPSSMYRMSLARQLLQQGGETGPVQHWAQGLDRAGRSIIGAYLAKSAMDEHKTRQKDYGDTLAKALTAARGAPAQPVGGPDFQGEMGAESEIPAQPGGSQAMIAALMGNPDTAPLGMQMQMGSMQRAEEMENALRLARQKQALEPPKSRTVKRNGVEVTEEFDPESRSWNEVAQSGIGYISPAAEQQRERIARAGATAINIDNKAAQAGATEAAKQGVGGGTPLTPAQQAVDKNFAEFYSQFVAQGGREDVNKNLSQLKGAIKELESGKNLSGTFIGMVPEWALPFVNPEALNVQEQVAEVAQRNLRAVLGGQFAEREGTQLIKRAYNPSLDEKVNAERVKRLFNSISKAMGAKMQAVEYFEKNGTLRGFKGKQWTMDDIAADAGLTDAPAAGGDGGGWSIERVR